MKKGTQAGRQAIFLKPFVQDPVGSRNDTRELQPVFPVAGAGVDRKITVTWCKKEGFCLGPCPGESCGWNLFGVCDSSEACGDPLKDLNKIRSV